MRSSFLIGLTQNCPSVVAPPRRTLVLSSSARLAGTILRKSYDVTFDVALNKLLRNSPSW
jgi:hypothetical protein